MTRKSTATFSVLIFLSLVLGGLAFSVYARTPLTQEVPRAQLVKLLEPPGDEYTYNAIKPHEEEVLRLCKAMHDRVGSAVYQVVHNNKRTLRTQNARSVVLRLRTLLANSASTPVERTACTSDVLSRILKETTWQLSAWQGMVAAGGFIDAGEYGAAVQTLERLADLKETHKASDRLIPKLGRLIPHLHMMTARRAIEAGDTKRAELFARRAVAYIMIRGEAFPGQRGRGLLTLADVFEAQGRIPDAELLAAEVMNLAVAANDHTTMAPVAYRKATLAAARGDASLARKFLKQSVISYETAGATGLAGYRRAAASLNEVTVWPEWLPYRGYLPG